MRPVDPRLLAQARTTRAFLAGSVLLGALGAVLVLAQATLIAEIVVRCFQRGQGLAALGTPLVLLAATAVGRALVAWLTELTAHRSVARVKSQLRRRLLEHATALGPGYLAGRRTGELTTLATRGVDALDDYFARYLPQLALAVVVPAVLLARIIGADWESAAIIAGTLPLIPLFMVLIGWATKDRMDRQWRSLARLSHHFLDVVAGLPTLKVFNRAKAQAEAVKRITDEYRRATLRTLRIAFVSSFALELLSTISVALVAVSIGFRLVDGSLGLETGLLVLILAPEVYFPLRQVGALYHASAEGLAAAEEVFAVLETPLPAIGTVPAPVLAGATVTVGPLTVTHPGRTAPALRGAALVLPPGSTTAVTGPSGAGKSTLLAVLLGFVRPDAGSVTVTAADGRSYDLAELAPESWRSQLAWVPQHPQLFAGTVTSNVRLARPEASDAEVSAALAAAHALDFVRRLPLGLETVLGEDGAGLSAGQRQRLALARALLTDRPLVLLDEPTANLDAQSEAAIVEAVRALAADPARTVLLVAHRPALLAVAERRVELTVPQVADVSRETLLVPQVAAEPQQSAASPAPVPVPALTLAASGAPLRRVAALFAAAEAGRARRRFALAVLLGSLALGCAVALLATSGWLISKASQQPPVLYLMMAVTSVRAFGVGRSFFRYCERLVSHDAVLCTLGSLRVTVYRRLERLAPTALPAFRRGDLLSRLVADVDVVQDWYLRWRLPAAVGLVVSLAASAGLALLLPGAGIALAVGLLLAGAVVPVLAARLSRRTERQQAPARGALATAVVDTCTGTAELTVAGALPARLGVVRAADARLTSLAARSATTTALGAGLMALLTGWTVVACAVVGVAGVRSGSLNGLSLALVILTPLAAFEAVTGLPGAVQIRERSRAAAARLTEMVDTPDLVAEPAAPAQAPADPFPLAVRGLRASWPGQQALALDGVDLDLAAGRRVAVVGPSGSGKTTLAHVLLRLLDQRSGSVVLAAGHPQAVDSRALDGDALRGLIGLCAQDAHVFDSSLRENLRLARPAASDTELRTVLVAARLLDWVDTLPDGLDTMVGEHGARLSGGQRQRLALARALLADFPLLILDEPAEHLDLPTADALTADLLAATEGRATLLITHRLAGLATAGVDEVVVLDGGRVVERGSWAELTARQDGRLRALWERETAADRLVGVGV
ncbi:ATP-binding cassette subfamily C protein CydCD [Kitasatospora sp. GAS204A]|uniref:thiol reductant ABC exporter subunit CydD n=1 Tax=unclassified Kitasatospora TaxID=2633591 RepID=UPI002474A7CC|nr:thiol reductant ABC exporter subunit CydD [Kitasatospora sp. GAS204B]MDH6119546.1 ATP-binding cassette subfamily C protein CydCD [Kitasatospora sp. GAS204B]